VLRGRKRKAAERDDEDGTVADGTSAGSSAKKVLWRAHRAMRRRDEGTVVSSHTH
jgi:hypothetical protein